MPKQLSGPCGVLHSEASSTAIRWLGEIGLDENEIVGGKGASLGDLFRLRMPVPNGYVVTTSVYAAAAEELGLRHILLPLLARRDWAAAARCATEVILARPIGAEVRDSILAGYRQLGSPAVAVRSSATTEDLDTASFAGQHDSFLNVSGEDALLEAIRRCWASLWSERALRYRHERSVDHLTARMAVVVEEMIQSEVSGVLFTVDPITHQSDFMRVEAAVGLGEAVVSGTSPTQTFLLDRRKLLPAEPIRDGNVLNRQQLAELSRAAIAIERHKRAPQDIEFAFAAGRLFVLQARAITTIADDAAEPLPVLGKPSLADKAIRPIAIERYAMSPRPFDNIVFTRVVGAVIYTIRRVGGAISTKDEAAFRSQIWRQAYRLPPVRLTPRFVFAQWKYFSLLKRDWLERWANGLGKQLRAECDHRNLTGVSDGELFEYTDRILAVWERALNERFYVCSAMNARPCLEAIVGLVIRREQRAQVLADLMSGLRTPTSDVNDALWELSRFARQDDAIRAALHEFRLEAIPATEPGENFRSHLNNFLQMYGHREGAGYYVSTKTWRQDPSQVLRLISSLAELDARAERFAVVQQRYADARTLVERRLRFLPGMRTLFGWLVERFRANDTFRETSHFDITRPVTMFQQIAAELTQRLRTRGILHREDDLFYLTYEEAREWCLGAAPPRNDINRLLAKRRATYALANARWQAWRNQSVPETGALLRGVAASRGVASGRARVIHDERDFDLLCPGEILVCPYSNPAWTPLFISAAAVVSETGGAASHVAIVAREYGIPAVMSVSGAMKALEQEPEVVVDGERGLVQIVPNNKRISA